MQLISPAFWYQSQYNNILNCCCPEPVSTQILVPFWCHAVFLFISLRYNWYYHTLPQAHMDNRVMYWPRGRVWGGSSSLNAMVYIRGHAEDYNRWQREGAEGWDYEHCLPYFRKAQCHELGENRYPTRISVILFFFIWRLLGYLLTCVQIILICMDWIWRKP